MLSIHRWARTSGGLGDPLNSVVSPLIAGHPFDLVPPFVMAAGGHGTIIGLVLVLVLGIGAKWISWRLKLPAILFLLLVGFTAGALGWLNPDELLGKLLVPIVSLSVSLILFEGGMTLQSSELPEVWRVVRNLCTIGALVTWAVLTAAGHYVLHFDLVVAALLGAILVVSGPTVVGPLLREIRPTGAVNSILKWEGIVIDPIGVLLAVLVSTALIGDVSNAGTASLMVVVKTFFYGSLLGLSGAVLLTFLLKQFLIPDHLQNPAVLMLVVTIFTVADILQQESGLLAVTVMGVVLANQKFATVRHIIEFKENLRVLIISSLFVLLAAKAWYDLQNIGELPYGYAELAIYFASVIVVARPLAVLFSTFRSGLSWKERLFLCFVAPKGIVAAALASILAIEAAQHGTPEAIATVPVAFLVIFGSVAFYGLTAGPVARKLGLAIDNPQGFLILGAHPWGRAIASELHRLGCAVLIVDSNRGNVNAARMEGIPAYYGDILSEHAEDEMELTGIGRFLSLTPNDEVNTLACMLYSELFDRVNVYQMAASQEGTTTSSELGGRRLFGDRVTFDLLNIRFSSGAVIKSTPITEEFTSDDYEEQYGEGAIRLFQVSPDGRVAVCVAGSTKSVEPGTTLVSLVYED